MKLRNLILFPGKRAKMGPVKTMDITLMDIFRVFFPGSFREKYLYLGSIPDKSDTPLFKAMEPLIIYMDYLAKPKFCPRWFLRFLNLFGDDNSIIRVRNRKLSDIKRKLTGGIMMWDYKTKWSYYDLRISVSGPKSLVDMARDIEVGFYNRGRQNELLAEIKKLDPNAKPIMGSIKLLEAELERLRG
jgi:hypothetical protein